MAREWTWTWPETGREWLLLLFDVAAIVFGLGLAVWYWRDPPPAAPLFAERGAMWWLITGFFAYLLVSGLRQWQRGEDSRSPNGLPIVLSSLGILVGRAWDFFPQMGWLLVLGALLFALGFLLHLIFSRVRMS